MIEKSYVLITPARNEEDYIEKTIQAVVSQTVLPKKWVIVNDGSTDRTEEIVKNYASRYEFIKFLSLARSSQRDFGAKVYAIRSGYELLKDEQYEFIGNLDADVSFDSQYYEEILARFQENPQLGIAGGIILELLNGRYRSQNISLNSVAGAIQLFRRQCYEKIGGYTPLKLGGVDAVVEISARKNGWQVQTFPKLKVFHHRRVAIREGKVLMTKFRQGVRDYLLGYHPLFYVVMCSYRIKERPYFWGSILRIGGYFWSAIKKEKRPVRLISSTT
jgi:glycosyltransferase involved in cell wall biosynthesis